MAKGKITRASVGAMKIARPLPVSGRHDEWNPPSVGAMKIARTLTVSERHIEWYKPKIFRVP